VAEPPFVELPPVPELDPPEPLAPPLPPVSSPPPVFDSLSSPQAVAKQTSEIARTIAPFVPAKERIDGVLLMAKSPLGRVPIGLRSRVSEKRTPARLSYFSRGS
jgi:hypothetical protein